MKIQSVTNGIKRFIGKGRVLAAGAVASVSTLAYSGLAFAQTTGFDTMASGAETELEGMVDKLAPIGVAIIMIAAAVAGVAVILRLTKKA